MLNVFEKFKYFRLQNFFHNKQQKIKKSNIIKIKK